METQLTRKDVIDIIKRYRNFVPAGAAPIISGVSERTFAMGGPGGAGLANSLASQNSAATLLTLTPTASNNLTVNHAVSAGYDAVYQIGGHEVLRYQDTGHAVMMALDNRLKFRTADTYIYSSGQYYLRYVATYHDFYGGGCGSPIALLRIGQGGNSFAALTVLAAEVGGNNTYLDYQSATYDFLWKTNSIEVFRMAGADQSITVSLANKLKYRDANTYHYSVSSGVLGHFGATHQFMVGYGAIFAKIWSSDVGSYARGHFGLGDSNSYFSNFTTGTQGADINYTLPAAVAAGNGYVLASTTGGVLSWANTQHAIDSSTHTIGSLTNLRIPVVCSSGNIFQDSPIYLDATKTMIGVGSTPVAPIQYGTNAINGSVDPVFLCTRSISSGSGNAHCFADNSVISRSGKIGYNSFDMEVTFSGTSTFDHYAGFQFVPTYSSSGKMDNMYANYIAPIINGPLGNYYGTTVGVPLGSGVIDAAYGIYINSSITRATVNWALYIDGPGQSKIPWVASPFKIGNTSYFYLWGDYAGYQEIPAGALMGGYGPNGNIGILASLDNATAGLKVALVYSSTSSHYYAAVEIANVASGFGSLYLMKSGGNVGIGMSGTPGARVHIAAPGLSDGCLELEDTSASGHKFWLYPRGGGTAGQFQLYDVTDSQSVFLFSDAGQMTIPYYSTAGILHNSAAGLISSSAIVAADLGAMGTEHYVPFFGATGFTASPITVDATHAMVGINCTADARLRVEEATSARWVGVFSNTLAGGHTVQIGYNNSTITYGLVVTGGNSDANTYDILVGAWNAPRFVVKGTGNVGIDCVPAGVLCVNGGVHVGGTTDAGDNNLLVDGTIKSVGAFGCNNATPQTPYASGGANGASGGAYGYDSAANAYGLVTLVNNIRAALVANGIMS
jgi:hypothetical protein